jgi:hypothetical protein
MRHNVKAIKNSNKPVAKSLYSFSNIMIPHEKHIIHYYLSSILRDNKLLYYNKFGGGEKIW